VGGLANALAQWPGFFPDPAGEVWQVVRALADVAERAPKLAHSSSAKLGAVAGLAALLGAQQLLPGLPASPGCLWASGGDTSTAKEALQVRCLFHLIASPWQVRLPVSADQCFASTGGPLT
jgi:hypothetical protein